MDTIVAANGANIIGRRGENEATRLLFPIAPWREQYGAGGRFELLAQRHGDALPYPVAITTDDRYVYWTINAVDTAEVGNGTCELFYYQGDVLAKSVIYTTIVFETMDDPGGVPEPYTSWVEQVHQYAIDAAESAADAAESAGYSEHPPIIGDNGNWQTWNGTAYVDSGEPSQGEAAEISEVSANATTLTPGDDATVSVTAGGTAQERTFTFDFGIPTGGGSRNTGGGRSTPRSSNPY